MMVARFQDLCDPHNPRNGELVADQRSIVELVDAIASLRPARMIELIGDNGFTLTIGVGDEFGCAQYAPSDGSPPYLMARELAEPQRDDDGPMEFVVGGTATPIDGRYRIALSTIRQVAADFIASGGRSASVAWEEFE